VDLLQHRLAGDPEDPSSLIESDRAFRRFRRNTAAELIGYPDVPGSSRGELFTLNEPVRKPPIEGRSINPENLFCSGDRKHEIIIIDGCDGFRLAISRNVS